MAQLNYNGGTPPAPSNDALVQWQYDASGNVTAYFPAASATQLGGVKQGSGVLIGPDGTLNAGVGSNVRIVTATGTTMLNNDFLILLEAATPLTITLPAAPSAGQLIEISSLTGGTGNSTINANTGQGIYAWSGTSVTSVTTVSIQQGVSVSLCYSAGNWYVLGVAAQQAGVNGYQATLAPATSSMIGLVKPGTGTAVATDGSLSLVIAGAGVFGGVKGGGAGITIAGDGTLNMAAPSGAAIGGVKAGPNVTIAADGTISVAAPTAPYVLPVATPSVLGGVKDGTGVVIAGDGTISASAAAAGVVGAVKPGANVLIQADGTLVGAAGKSCRNVTTNYVMALTDYFVYASGGSVTSITLPASPYAGQTVEIFNMQSATVAVTPSSSTIASWASSGITQAASVNLYGWSSARFLWNGTYWFTVNVAIPQQGASGYYGSVVPGSSSLVGGVKAGTGVSIATDGTLGIMPSSAWVNYSPNVTASGSMTIANITYTRAYYMIQGSVCFVDLLLKFDTGGTASNAIYIVLPVSALTNQNMFATMSLQSGWTPAFAYSQGSAIAAFANMSGNNFTLMTAYQYSATFWYRIN